MFMKNLLYARSFIKNFFQNNSVRWIVINLFPRRVNRASERMAFLIHTARQCES